MERFEVETIKQKSDYDIEQIDDLVTTTGGQCDWVLQKGKNVGRLCGKRCVLGTKRCKYHYDKEQDEFEFESEPEFEPDLISHLNEHY